MKPLENASARHVKLPRDTNDVASLKLFSAKFMAKVLIQNIRFCRE
jgi:hypothetical protein